MTLTDEEIRIKVAEACGWRKEYIHGNGIDDEVWICPKSNRCWLADSSPLPNYPEDLNAANEMEETLSEEERPVFVNNLYLIALEHQKVTGKWRYSSLPARQRCLAYLKTKGILP